MERREFFGVTGPHWSAYRHELVAGKRAKILLLYRGAYRSLLWLDARPDGSVVLGAGIRATSMERRARRRASDRPLPPKLAAAVGESEVPQGLHLSFHASGVINVGGVRAYRARLAGPELHQLCSIDFAHPSLHHLVEKEAQDVVLPYLPREEASVRGRLTVMPTEVVAFFDDVPVQTAILLQFRRPDDSSLLLQLSLLEQDKPWPRDSTVEYVSQDPEDHGFQG